LDPSVPLSGARLFADDCTFTWHTNNRNDYDLLHRIHQHMTNGDAVANEFSPKEIKNSFTQAAHPTD
jgi:hypothetical protein